MPSTLCKIRSLAARANTKRALQILAVIVLIGFTATLIYYFHDPTSLEGFKDYGYLGVFLVTIISCATVFFPLPGAIVIGLVAGMPGISPLLVGVVAGTGSTLGELSGYFTGYWGGAAIKVERWKWYQRAEQWMKRYGSLTVFVFALTPLPFDLAGLAAGSLRFPLWKFLLACWAGKVPQCILIAYLGSTVIKHFFPGLF